MYDGTPCFSAVFIKENKIRGILIASINDEPFLLWVYHFRIFTFMVYYIEKPYGEALVRNVVYFSITTSSHATSVT